MAVANTEYGLRCPHHGYTLAELMHVCGTNLICPFFAKFNVGNGRSGQEVA